MPWCFRRLPGSVRHIAQRSGLCAPTEVQTSAEPVSPPIHLRGPPPRFPFHRPGSAPLARSEPALRASPDSWPSDPFAAGTAGIYAFT